MEEFSNKDDIWRFPEDNGNKIEKKTREIQERARKNNEEFEIYNIDRSFDPIEPKKGPILWSEFNSKELPEVSWYIQDLIPLEGFVTISSPSGEKKSWLSLYIAKSISLGINFLGEEFFKTTQAKVLYLDAENSEREMIRRGRQLKFEPTENLFIYHVNDLNLNEEDKALELLELIKKDGYNVIIIDTFRSVAGGIKEEKAEEIRTFFNRFKVLKDSGVVVIWLDHCRKRQTFEGKSPVKEMLLGSVDKTASIEILLMLSSDPGSSEIRVYQRKNRLGCEIQPFKIEMVDEVDNDGHKTTELRYGGLIEDQETKKEEAKELILELLSDGSNKLTKEILQTLGMSNKIGGKNIRMALKDLVDSSKIDYKKIGKQNSYFIVRPDDAGKQTKTSVKDEVSNIFDNF